MATKDKNGSEKQDITLAKLFFQAKSGLIAVAVFSLFLNLLMLTAPLYMLQVFDRVLTSHSLDTLFWLTVIAAGAFLILSLLDIIRNRILGAIGAWIDRSFGSVLVQSSLHQAAIKPSQTLPSSNLRDLALIRNFLSGNGTLALIDVPWTPFFIFIIYLLHPWLGVVAIAGITILILLAVLGEVGARRLLYKSGGEFSKLQSTVDSASYTADALVSMAVLPRIINKWKQQNDTLLKQAQAVNGKIASVVAVGKFVRMTLQIIIMAVGAYLVINEELSPGGMMAASIIMTRALAPIEQLIGAWRAFIGSRDAIKRVLEQLNTVNSKERVVVLPQPHGLIEAEKLSFALPSENRFVFRDISFTLKPGEILGIIGASGSGKSTLAKILIGLLKPTTGHARVDGSDISRWKLDEMGQYIGYLPQGFELFEGTIKQNIARYSDAAIDDVIDIAKLAGIHEFIVRLPDGYETYVTKNSAVLSGGQQQRIALARALFGDPSIIVMDEPNANLDPEGEKALLKAIRQLKKQGKTIILIAHRSNVLRCSDHLLAINDGRASITSRKQPTHVTDTLGDSYEYVDKIDDSPAKPVQPAPTYGEASQ